MTTTTLPFAEDTPTSAQVSDALVLSLNGFDGPIDLLLTLAKDQKLDLKQISILQLADQYLAFIAEVRKVRLELAADYLVMAAWLAYLKSRLLLPEPDEVKPSAEEMAEALAFQLRRLEAMQQAGANLMGRALLGRDVFHRGEPESIRPAIRPIWQVSVYELYQAYGSYVARQQKDATLHIALSNLYSVDEALARLTNMLGHTPVDWATLSSFLPPATSPLQQRSAIASTLVASLELARSGQLEIRQENTFGPIYLRRTVQTGVS